MTDLVPEVAEGRATDDGLDALEGLPGLPLGPDPVDPSAPPAPAAPGDRGWLRRLWFVPAGVALLGAAALVPAVGGRGPGAGEARVLVDGEAVVTEADGDVRTVRDDRVDIGPGDRIALVEGRATFEMAGDVRLEGRGREEGRAGTTVEMAVAPRLVTGPLLAVAPEPLDVEAGDATVSIAPTGSTAGAARLDRRLGLAVGTYRGRIEVETAGRRAEVPRHRRVEVAAPGAIDDAGRPIRYEADDAWDRRFLGDALVIDAQVGPLLASLGPAERASFLDPATLRAAMTDLPSGGGLAERLGELSDGADALVLAAIAVVVDDRSFTTAWDQAADFEADGAPWGLAAADQGARSADVLPALREALDTLDLQAPLAVADDEADADTDAEAGVHDPATVEATEAAPADAGAAGGTGGRGPTDGGPGGGTTDPAGGGGSGPGATPPTVPGVTPPTVPGVPTPTVPAVPSVPEVVEGVGGTVGGVVGGVGGVVDEVLPGTGEVIGGTGEVLGGVVGGLGTGLGGLGDGLGGVGATVTGDAGQVVGALGEVVSGVGAAVDGLGTGLATGIQTGLDAPAPG